ncbi:YjjG family noncanonical pyrimidine nucleotidase [Flavobacterium johnsoniae]|jgi:putative hydrolase of the HAD superfamily|uniref:HAD-superfamily hydrolase, subfamily IA, variant 1 n=1 Tax=Flavobacterium johnsoniae (strain ATCC 17061 / DSM 2064 / JCM 8514 / BCRC 14874 / CCUG 350202 / NBRC 14942 / NCIMB 11054 / UW101) TaxID=376686 RepID=A5FMW4_FLAJ1|nr:YjjG family noncanonical pyrimidine nucleotidase [Flavobacterium johnsoniae]ABQ03448.1 HAD-superfamily hydrolase, subfamily IA, variant 1 [Flavobacterium johnsoniae UW101]OXG01137.1 noncanonical pyrimidine nucleotidase, YjjG family [Flavobacterium johnsoniae UW101]WQG79688.1 YjjG family noncanonical pyrimidine nucleotidase [Flavobacterium johnsoniae UW101]SHL74869.1 putative hydrolase of the HAD superfamily [Flavobacterium johnsoniae]
MNTNITDIFFDLDHTLWDFDKNSQMAFDRIFKNNFEGIKIEDFIEKYLPINQECWRLYQNDQITHQELRYNRLKLSFDALNYSMTDENIDQISNDYIEFLTDNNYLFDGAIEVLEYLKPKYKLHIITNGFAHVQEKKINNASLGGYFTTITNSELAGVKKPNSIIFDYAVNLAQSSKENSIMIGDDFDADVNGALNAGMDAIFFNVKNIETPQNYKQINHLLELKKYL